MEGAMQDTAATQPTTERQSGLRGRPRDPALEPRVFDAALSIYAAQGWEGFTFEQVARVAGVGKNALYRRWPTKGALLREVLRERWVSADTIHEGNLRDDLRALCRMLFAHLTGPLGRVGLQLQLDIVRYEVVAEAVAGYSDGVQRSSRAIVRRAKERGEIPADISSALLMNVISGAVMSRVSATPEPLREEMLARADDFIESLVALVYRGLTAPG
jgi:AcrR family transcriptional regulator